MASENRPSPELMEVACEAIGRAHDEGDGTADFEDTAAAVIADLEPLIRQQVLGELTDLLTSDEAEEAALNGYLAATLSGPGSARKHARERLRAALQAAISKVASIKGEGDA